MKAQLSPEQLAWEILGEAEEAFEAISVSQDAAARQGLPQPQTIPEILGWIEAEAAAQEELLVDDPKNSDRVYAQALRELAEELRSLGFESLAAVWS